MLLIKNYSSLYNIILVVLKHKSNFNPGILPVNQEIESAFQDQAE